MRGFLFLLFFGWMCTSVAAQSSVVRRYVSSPAVSHEADTTGFQVVHRFFNRNGEEQLELAQSLIAGEKLRVEYAENGGVRNVVLSSKGQNNLGPPSEARYGFDEQQRMLYQEFFYIDQITTRIEYRYDAEGRRSETIMCNPPRGW